TNPDKAALWSCVIPPGTGTLKKAHVAPSRQAVRAERPLAAAFLLFMTPVPMLGPGGRRCRGLCETRPEAGQQAVRVGRPPFLVTGPQGDHETPALVKSTCGAARRFGTAAFCREVQQR